MPVQSHVSTPGYHFLSPNPFVTFSVQEASEPVTLPMHISIDFLPIFGHCSYMLAEPNSDFQCKFAGLIVMNQMRSFIDQNHFLCIQSRFQSACYLDR